MSRNHSRNITQGDVNYSEAEPKFVLYASGKVVLNFGKYKTKNITEVPDWYLRFLLEKVGPPHDVIPQIEKELKTR